MWSEIEHPPDEEISTALVQCIDLFNDPACPWMPDVKRLTLRTLGYLPAVGTAVQGLSNLEHFSCDLCMDRQLLNKLAILPRLKSIDLRWLLSDVARSLIPSRPSFAAIESFRLLGAIDSISATLPLITSIELTTVRLGIKGLELNGLDSSLITLLVPPSVPARALSLRHFHLVGPSFRHLVASLPNHLALGDFAPLCSCHALETFWIDMSLNEVVCTDVDVHAMAEAWPKLIRLSINGPLRAMVNRSPPRARLYTLWSLAIHCPRLSDLSIEIDARVTDPFYATSTSVVKGSEMEQVSFHFSPCGEPEMVAAFLRVAFPGLSLSAFSAHSNLNNPEDQARWVDVGRMLE
ncbi:unnamed protein product [Mycena citricolor]|uniref:F-box protein n=1 Tax=Mycena citricolor TaxID=2018698 RepID=A0AAD2GTY8_9AGAR|nr:unnamed protein product [Mycena citricolor]